VKWLGTSACMERITAMSSMHSPDVEKNLADFDPALTVALELEWGLITVPFVVRFTRCMLSGSVLAGVLSSAGL